MSFECFPGQKFCLFKKPNSAHLQSRILNNPMVPVSLAQKNLSLQIWLWDLGIGNYASASRDVHTQYLHPSTFWASLCWNGFLLFWSERKKCQMYTSYSSEIWYPVKTINHAQGTMTLISPVPHLLFRVKQKWSEREKKLFFSQVVVQRLPLSKTFSNRMSIVK